MSIRLTKIYVENFKSIKNLSTSLSFSNAFFGKNSAGKSAILKAINVALSDDELPKNDLFVNEKYPFDEKKKIIIDLCFEPEDIDTVHFDDEWASLFGDNVGKLGYRDRDVFAFRTIFTFDKASETYIAKRYVIDKFYYDGKSKIGEELQIGILQLHIHSFYINASENGDKNLEERKDYWKRMLEVTDLIKNIDYSLYPSDVEEDLKNFDISFANQLINEKMNEESAGVSSVLVFETLKKQIAAICECLKPFHAIVLIEEPEAHLHPQAQMQIMNIINSIQGQKYIATHSSYIVNHYPIHKLVRVVNEGEGSKVYKFDNHLSMKELKTINLKCMLYKAEMIFANKVVLFEGQTEHIALPIYFKKYFGCYPFEMGYSFVYVEGSNNYKAYLEICNAFHIDWCVYSDGERVVINFLNNMMKEITGRHHYDTTKDNHFVIIKNEMCYEDDLIYHGFVKDVSQAIDQKEKDSDYIRNKVLNTASFRQFKLESKKYIPGVDDYLQAVSLYSKRHKIDMAELVARTVCHNHESNDLPASILELFNKIK